MAGDALLFTFTLIDDALLLFLAVYYVITLSDLECDYINATQCCDRLNRCCILVLLIWMVLSPLIGVPDTSCSDVKSLIFINWFVLAEIVAFCVIPAGLLFCNVHWVLFLVNLPFAAWIINRYLSKPSGDIGLFDAAEIHNRHTLKGHMKEAMVKLGYHLVFFFIYLYSMIASLLS